MPPEGGARTAGSCWKERGTNLWFVLDLSAAVRQQKERGTNRWFVLDLSAAVRQQKERKTCR